MSLNDLGREMENVRDYTPLTDNQIKREIEEMRRPENLLMVVKFKNGKWVSTRINERCKVLNGM